MEPARSPLILDQIRRHEAYKEQIRRERQTEREKFEKHLQEHRHLVWRNRTAVRLLGTSVDDLFLFFAQRIANLAGSRRLHNDKLRANGMYENIVCYDVYFRLRTYIEMVRRSENADPLFTCLSHCKHGNKC